MSSISQSMLVHRAPSDHLGSSINGLPLRDLARSTRLHFSRSDRNSFSIVARLRRGRKREYPWPRDPDPNVKGGVLTHLSPFKPLQDKDKPKPVILDFEKPLVDLQKKIVEVKRMANETGLDFTDQIASLEHKYHQALTELYMNLTPIQRVNIARHPHRPTFLDHVFNITEKFVELHGDRAGYDDPAIVTGLGTINGRSYMFIGHQKGRNTKENVARNFGMPTPHGYRKALRMMRYADHHGFPIVTFIDTPGAYADLKSEELGQGEAIAQNLRTMFGLKVPIVSIVIGEGGSGGALAIACANKLLMLENAVFYVASPEACAAILWKNAQESPKAAKMLKITATELRKLRVADGVIPEPLGGAHADPSWTSQQIRKAIVESMDELVQMDTEELLRRRTAKFRKIGRYRERIPVDRIKKANMKRKEEPRTSNLVLENEVEKLKQQILKGKDLSSPAPNLGVDEMIEKLKAEVDHELSEATQALGLTDRLMKLQEELTRAKNSQDELIHPALLDKVERFKDELRQRLSSAPNYASLSAKLDMLKQLSKAKQLSSDESAMLKQQVTQRLNEVMQRDDIKNKIETLKADVSNSGASSVDDLDDRLKQRIIEVKHEIKKELVSALRSMEDLKLEVVEKPNIVARLPTNLVNKFAELDKEIQNRIEDTMKSSDLKYKINMLKLEAAKAGKSPDPGTQNRIQGLIKEIKENLAQALSTSELLEKHQQLETEIHKAIKVDGTSNSTPNEEPRVEAQAGRTYA